MYVELRTSLSSYDELTDDLNDYDGSKISSVTDYGRRTTYGHGPCDRNNVKTNSIIKVLNYFF